MRQGEQYPYEIIKHNFRTLSGHESVDVVKGLSAAERAVEFYDRKLTQAERDDGWRYFHQRTTKKPRTKARPRPNYKPGSFKKRF